MEIEAKFVVPDKTTARTLRALDHLADFSLGAPTRLTMRDTFFDTRANDLLKTRHVLRVRQRSDGRAFFTFKAPAPQLVPSAVGRVIAEWSLDYVKFRAGARQRAFYELEIELKKSGNDQELKEIVESLQKKVGLEAQSQSKFARAVAFMSES